MSHRRCPGLHLVESSLWLALVSILGNLEATKVMDAHGNVIEPEVKFENMIFRYAILSLQPNHSGL